MPAVRGPNGKFIRNLGTVEQDRRAAELRSARLTYEQIAAALTTEFSITPPMAVTSAYDAVQRGLIAQPSEKVAEAKEMVLLELDRLARHFLGVMQRRHVRVDHGRVIQVPDPADPEKLTPLLDDGPGMQAALGYLRVMERKAKLLGLDAPTKHRVEVVSRDTFMEAFEELEREVAAKELLLAEQEATGQ